MKAEIISIGTELLLGETIDTNSNYLSKELQEIGIDLLYQKRSTIPAVTHVDFSARIQTVHSKTNQFFHELLVAFKKKTRCPILVNTSFNIRGEPIVESPQDAVKCFLGTNLDVLCIGNFILLKEDQNSAKLISYKDEFDLD